MNEMSFFGQKKRKFENQNPSANINARQEKSVRFSPDVNVIRFGSASMHNNSRPFGSSVPPIPPQRPGFSNANNYERLFGSTRMPTPKPFPWLRPNPDSKPVYETPEWDPVFGRSYRSSFGGHQSEANDRNVGIDCSPIVEQLRRSTDTLKEELKSLKECVDTSNQRLLEAIKQSNEELKKSLIEGLAKLAKKEN